MLICNYLNAEYAPKFDLISISFHLCIVNFRVRKREAAQGDKIRGIEVQEACWQQYSTK